jgi:hypothetical protein
MEDLSTLNYDDLTAVAKLTSEPHYQSVMQVGQGVTVCTWFSSGQVLVSAV